MVFDVKAWVWLHWSGVGPNLGFEVVVFECSVAISEFRIQNDRFHRRAIWGFVTIWSNLNCYFFKSFSQIRNAKRIASNQNIQ